MMLRLGLTLLMLVAPTAWAHSPVSGGGQEQLAALLSALVLVAVWVVYLVGAWRVRPAWLSLGLFSLSVLLAFSAVLGPLDAWAETSTSWHMVQHMLFMVVIAPLFVLARPLPQMAAGGARAGSLIWNPLLRLAQHPMLAAYLHGLVIWFWHVPRFYVLALDNPWWHVFEHACFLLTAGLFWWAVLKSSPRRVHWALFALLFTLMHTGFLGAMLTFAQSSLYGPERALADQQLAGMIMWVLGAFPYLLASAWIGYRWYRQVQVRLNR
ncbi:cytochrome c oxidase assembly protein [Halopseudomonas sp.]|uniref:cytochrome c oxidase assembly protein n=1 Tax=Halopseudomonas sp. TaxID=2901191 RepID=UPI0030026F65